MDARLQALIELRETLARLVPTRDEIHLVLHDAGLDSTRIDLDGTAQIRCFHVVEATDRQAALPRLIEVMLRRHPSHRLALQALGERLGVPVVHPPPSRVTPRPPGDVYSAMWHVERPQEAEILALIEDAATPCWLAGAGTMGKSWMVQRIIERVHEQRPEVLTLEVPFGLMDGASTDGFLRDLAGQLVDRVDGDAAAVGRTWAQVINPRIALTRLLERDVLPRVPGALLLLFEVADDPQIWSRWSEFVGVLRQWHQFARRAPWNRLRLLVAMSTTPGEWAGETHRSAFNVPVVELDELGPEEVRELAWRHGLAWDPTEHRQVGELIGRADRPHPRPLHPHLARLVMWETSARSRPVSAVLGDAAAGRGEFGAHLARMRAWLSRRPEARAAFLDVCQGALPRSARRDAMLMLRAAGLVVDGVDRPSVRLGLYRSLGDPP